MGERRHRVVVIGGGFGGLQAVLAAAPRARRDHPRRPAELPPLPAAHLPGGDRRAVARGDRLSAPRDLQAEPQRPRPDGRGGGLRPGEARALLRPVAGIPSPDSLAYDTLIVAGGSRYSYFGHEEWREHAAEVKSLESALIVRSRLLSAFEAAEEETDPERQARWLTFVVVGAGPTGVEMAGQIAELAHDSLRREFRSIDPSTARILLVEAADRVLTSFPASLSAKAERSLASSASRCSQAARWSRSTPTASRSPTDQRERSASAPGR